ncbi:MAG: hypothetical protein IPH88_05825 [Bacteroidales bacterium]|nr:hypothetical protein [Bacteroidales bacterium]
MGQTSVQNFGTGTGSHTSSTGSTSFIPNQPGNEALANGSGSINLVTSANPLGTTGSYVRGVASTGTSVTKFSPWVGYTGSTEFYTSFKVLFGDVSAGSQQLQAWSFIKELADI